MGCTVRTNRHGFLGFRLYWHAIESHEGTKLLDTPENKARCEARAERIEEEIREGVFDYLRWFPNGNQAWRFRQPTAPEPRRLTTIAGFFARWAEAGEAAGHEAAALGSKQAAVISAKWLVNRASLIRNHVVPFLGQKRLDEIKAADLIDLQGRLGRKGLRASTIEGTVHSALRAMLRDAKLQGFAVANLPELYDRAYIRRLAAGSDAIEIDPFSEDERDQIIEGFGTKRDAYFAFVFFQFWTGARPSEAIALRWGNVDLQRRWARIRASRVLGREGRTKTGKSRRDVLLHESVVEVLRDHTPLHPKHDAFVFTTPTGTRRAHR